MREVEAPASAGPGSYKGKEVAYMDIKIVGPVQVPQGAVQAAQAEMERKRRRRRRR